MGAGPLGGFGLGLSPGFRIGEAPIVILPGPEVGHLLCVVPSPSLLVCTVAAPASLSCVVVDTWALPPVCFTR